jgi:hypothetical protein
MLSFPTLGGSLSPQHGGSLGCGWRNGLQLWRLAAYILSKQPRTTNNGWYSSLGVERGASNPSSQTNNVVTNLLPEPWTWTDSLDKRPQERNMDMRFGTRNIRSLYRAGSLMSLEKTSQI